MRKKRLVIVEDELDMRQLLQIELETEGYEVLTADNGSTGLELVKKAKPDLVILDVMMPEIDGYEMCQILKQDPETKDIPIMMLTAKGLKDEIHKGLEAGVDGYMLKPFNSDILLKKIQALLID